MYYSAGTGRTGAFIALDTALGQARGERRMDIPDILTRLRNQRMKMVQTPVRDPPLYHCISMQKASVVSQKLHWLNLY